MISMGTVIGRATATYEDRGALYVVVQWKDTGKFKGHVSCRFYGDAKKYAEKASHGDLVIVQGEVASREHNGKWYTDFNGRYLQVEEAAQQTRGRTASARDDPPPPDDSDSLGF